MGLFNKVKATLGDGKKPAVRIITKEVTIDTDSIDQVPTGMQIISWICCEVY